MEESIYLINPDIIYLINSEREIDFTEQIVSSFKICCENNIGFEIFLHLKHEYIFFKVKGKYDGTPIFDKIRNSYSSSRASETNKSLLELPLDIASSVLTALTSSSKRRKSTTCFP
jgi:hypothetical protein